MINVFTPLLENKEEKRAEIVWFGFLSPRGAFKLKTTLHKLGRGGGVLMLMVDTGPRQGFEDVMVTYENERKTINNITKHIV